MITVAQLLRKLGITKIYKGYEQAIYCISLAVEDDFRLTAITKEIYMVTATKFGCKWTAIERNMRTIVKHAWTTNKSFLCNIAGYPINHEPTVSEFIEIIAYRIRSEMQNNNHKIV